MAIGPDGSLYAAGSTFSKNFPVRNAQWPNCQLGPRQSCSDAFLLRITPDRKELVFSTYVQLSQTGVDEIGALAVDHDGNAYVSGTYEGNKAFAGKFTKDGNMVYLRTFSGYPITLGRGIAVDRDGNAFLTGATLSESFPTVAPLQPQPGKPSCKPGGSPTFPHDAFVVKLSPNGGTVFSTYLGGDGDDFGKGVAVDGEGNVYVVGETSSRNFPLVNPYQDSYAGGEKGSPSCSGGDLFLTKLDPAGQKILYSTYLGGNGNDEAAGVTVGPRGEVIVYGNTASGDLLTTGTL
ncbi:MAG: SBBP repeat-containing protein, partial [Acidobacteria bacterium]|nr:SBBP repeat-containing protein [Acidobacteriota bacterium]